MSTSTLEIQTGSDAPQKKTEAPEEVNFNFKIAPEHLRTLALFVLALVTAANFAAVMNPPASLWTSAPVTEGSGNATNGTIQAPLVLHRAMRMKGASALFLSGNTFCFLTSVGFVWKFLTGYRHTWVLRAVLGAWLLCYIVVAISITPSYPIPIGLHIASVIAAIIVCAKFVMDPSTEEEREEQKLIRQKLEAARGRFNNNLRNNIR